MIPIRTWSAPTQATFILQNLNTGVKGAFETLGPDPTQVKKISSFKITLNGDFANSKLAALKVRIGNHYLDKFGISYTVAGDVTNTGTDAASYTEGMESFTTSREK